MPMDPITSALGLARSAGRCGEPWDAACDAAVDAALEENRRLRRVLGDVVAIAPEGVNDRAVHEANEIVHPSVDPGQEQKR